MHDEDQLGERESWVDSVDIINVPQFKPVYTCIYTNEMIDRAGLSRMETNNVYGDDKRPDAHRAIVRFVRQQHLLSRHSERRDVQRGATGSPTAAQISQKGVLPR